MVFHPTEFHFKNLVKKFVENLLKTHTILCQNEKKFYIRKEEKKIFFEESEIKFIIYDIRNKLKNYSLINTP